MSSPSKTGVIGTSKKRVEAVANLALQASYKLSHWASEENMTTYCDSTSTCSNRKEAAKHV